MMHIAFLSEFVQIFVYENLEKNNNTPHCALVKKCLMTWSFLDDINYKTDACINEILKFGMKYIW